MVEENLEYYKIQFVVLNDSDCEIANHHMIILSNCHCCIYVYNLCILVAYPIFCLLFTDVRWCCGTAHQL